MRPRGVGEKKKSNLAKNKMTRDELEALREGWDFEAKEARDPTDAGSCRGRSGKPTRRSPTPTEASSCLEPGSVTTAPSICSDWAMSYQSSRIFGTYSTTVTRSAPTSSTGGMSGKRL